MTKENNTKCNFCCITPDMIKVEHGKNYPSLHSAALAIIIDGIRYKFPPFCLTWHGADADNDNWTDHITDGSWSVNEWPGDFPDGLKSIAEIAINRDIQPGCDGGHV
ncbi:MAG: hypothetical protein GY861_01205 [bacterium]|nr:hypothetical protein [bacterium]